MPSAGLAPTEPADSIDWQPKRRRWQFAVGAAALVASAMMFLVSRSGDAQVADAAAFSQRISGLDQTAPVASTITAAAPAPIAPPNLAATVMSGAEPQPTTARPSTHRSSAATHRASTRKAPAVPRRAAARLDPDGTIDPYR